MKKIICDICKQEVNSVDEIEVPIKLTKNSTSYTTENEKIDICAKCNYELKLQNALNLIKTVKKLRKSSKRK